MESKDFNKEDFKVFIVDELDNIIADMSDKAFCSDLQKQSQIRASGKKLITGRLVKREFTLSLHDLESFKEKLVKTLIILTETEDDETPKVKKSNKAPKKKSSSNSKSKSVSKK